MSAVKPRRQAPRSTGRLPGHSCFTACGDGHSLVNVELSIPFATDPREKSRVLANLRLFVGNVLGREHGANGWVDIDLPINEVEAIAKDFSEAVAQARHHGILPGVGA